MSYFLPRLESGWHVDQAILAEDSRVVVIRFGHDLVSAPLLDMRKTGNWAEVLGTRQIAHGVLQVYIQECGVRGAVIWHGKVTAPVLMLTLVS